MANRQGVDSNPMNAEDLQLHQVAMRHLERIPTVMGRITTLAKAGLAESSPAAADMAEPLGNLVWTFATAALATGIGHAYAWLQIAETGLIPERAHFTLARAALEGAVTCRWLTDGKSTGRTRRARAAGVQWEDHEERRKAEDAWVAEHELQARPSAFNALHDRTQHERECHAAGLDFRSRTSMAARMVAFGNGSWLWRAASAFAHNQPWSARLNRIGEQYVVEGLTGSKVHRATSNSIYAAWVALSLADLLELATNELAAYGGRL